MSDSPESVVRGLFAAWEDLPNLDRTISFFADDAVYEDGPRGVHRGIDAIRSEVETQAGMMEPGSLKVEVMSLVADRGTVMVERVDNFNVGDRPFSLEAMAAFEIDADGRIKRWRDYYDLASIADQMAAPGPG